MSFAMKRNTVAASSPYKVDFLKEFQQKILSKVSHKILGPFGRNNRFTYIYTTFHYHTSKVVRTMSSMLELRFSHIKDPLWKVSLLVAFIFKMAWSFLTKF